MKKIITIITILLSYSCMDADFDNEPLCTYVICGEVMNDKVNVTVFNNTNVDFDQLIWSVGGQGDTVDVLAFDQFSCWNNFDSLSISYVFAKGLTGQDEITADTLFFNEAIIDTVYRGNYRLTLSAINNNDRVGGLMFSLDEGYEGQCVSF